jgi:hypothetical protein
VERRLHTRLLGKGRRRSLSRGGCTNGSGEKCGRQPRLQDDPQRQQEAARSGIDSRGYREQLETLRGAGEAVASLLDSDGAEEQESALVTALG